MAPSKNLKPRGLPAPNTPPTSTQIVPPPKMPKTGK